jgi:molybdopterin synthase sulfur carrier subunit
VIRVVLPAHLRQLAGVNGEVQLSVPSPVTMSGVIDSLEREFPGLRGTLRQAPGRRRPLLRFFACEQDLSHAPLDDPLPDDVVGGSEPLLVVGAMAGG